MKNHKFTSKDRIGIVANDAGASNLIMGWVSHHKFLNFFFCLSGPSKKIFQDNHLFGAIYDIEEIMKTCNVIITGTSYESMLEHNARLKAKKSKILSIAVLDHWVNYELRFIRNKQKVLPNIIWVFDEFAEKKAKNLFKNINIERQKNFYINDLAEKINKLGRKNDYKNTNILYVLEPMRKNSKIIGYLYEYEILDFFINKIRKMNFDNDLDIKLRLHPSEESKKYDKWLHLQNKRNISISLEKSLCEDIAWADIVVGYDSYALVVANAASKICFSSKLHKEGDSKLMIKDLRYLRDI